VFAAPRPNLWAYRKIARSRRGAGDVIRGPWDVGHVRITRYALRITAEAAQQAVELIGECLTVPLVEGRGPPRLDAAGA
jgi:hypothetical protein